MYFKHNVTETAVYRVWQNMKQRSLNKTCVHYKNYGKRGIKVCKRWLLFKNFYEDMGDKPKGLTLERIDNNKGYYKSNCKWATRSEQQNNTRYNVPILYKGITKNISEWAKKLNIPIGYLTYRLKKNISIGNITRRYNEIHYYN